MPQSCQISQEWSFRSSVSQCAEVLEGENTDFLFLLIDFVLSDFANGATATVNFTLAL